MKYIFLILETRDGEREYTHPSVHIISKKSDSDKWADKYCKNFWGKADEKSDGGYYFFGMEIHTKVERVQDISKEQFDTLKQFI